MKSSAFSISSIWLWLCCAVAARPKKAFCWASAICCQLPRFSRPVLMRGTWCNRDNRSCTDYTVIEQLSSFCDAASRWASAICCQLQRVSKPVLLRGTCCNRDNRLCTGCAVTEQLSGFCNAASLLELLDFSPAALSVVSSVHWKACSSQVYLWQQQAGSCTTLVYVKNSICWHSFWFLLSCCC